MCSTLDNHMKKQHGLNAPPRQTAAPFSSRNRGRPKKPSMAATATSSMAAAAHHGMEMGGSGGEEGGWGGPLPNPHDPTGYGPSGHAGQIGPHKELSARPVGQVNWTGCFHSAETPFTREEIKRKCLCTLARDSVSDPHKFSYGSGSRIPKMSIWIRIRMRIRIQGGKH